MVVIGTPNDTHCPLVLECAAAGKHVVLEKPMCLSLAEADSMIAACKPTPACSSCMLRSSASRPSTCV